ncbi:MAG: hypothetical protein U0525_03810 [Patescibacteria group bacterium]
MHQIPHLLKKIPKSTIEIFFFGMIFTIYFMSSVGIMNTMDGAQYYTTEALIQYNDVNLRPMTKYEHFFSKNDLAYDGNKILPLRGVHQSIIAMPLHFLSRFFAPYVSTNDFPISISSARDFAYELTITGLYSLFSVLGVYFVFKTLQTIGISRKMSFFTSFVLAFGTPVWKYATAYIRQGMIFLFFAFTLYVFARCLFKNNKNNILPISIWLLILPFSFGIDPIGFASVCGAIAIFILLLIKNKKRHKLPSNPFKSKNIRISILFIVIFITSSAFVLFTNFYFFKSLMSTQYEKYPPFATVPKDKLLSVVFGTPIYPTIFYVLFGSSALPVEIFENTLKYPEISKVVSVPYAIRYEFYGIFIITPIFLLIFASIYSFFKYASKKQKFMYAFSSIITIIFIIPTVMWHAFHAPNSYDLKYFYPIFANLSILFAISLKYWPAIKTSSVFKYAFILLFILTIFFGFIGVLNAYPSYMTGERRIWINTPFHLIRLFSTPTKTMIDAVFANRANIFVPVLLTGFAIIINFVYLQFDKRKRNLATKKGD